MHATIRTRAILEVFCILKFMTEVSQFRVDVCLAKVNVQMSLPYILGLSRVQRSLILSLCSVIPLKC
jgi:hypothetical protein